MNGQPTFMQNSSRRRKKVSTYLPSEILLKLDEFTREYNLSRNEAIIFILSNYFSSRKKEEKHEK